MSIRNVIFDKADVSIAAGLFVFFTLYMGQAVYDLADAQRRIAAAHCIDSWHVWVRGTRSPVKRPDAEWCMALAGIDPPAGIEEVKTAGELYGQERWENKESATDTDTD